MMDSMPYDAKLFLPTDESCIAASLITITETNHNHDCRSSAERDTAFSPDDQQ